MRRSVTVFAIYAWKDKDAVGRLIHRLKPLGGKVDLTIWQEDPIYPEQAWAPRIPSRIQKAEVFLFLLSNAFMYSEFINQNEFKAIIDRYKEGSATVIPVLLEECPWNTDFKSDDYDFNFNELQVLPEERKPIKSWGSEEEAYVNIASHLERTILSFSGVADPEPSNQDQKEHIEDDFTADRLAIPFSEEEAEAKRIAGEEQRSQEEVETARRAKERKRLKEEAESKRKNEEEKRRRIEAENLEKIEKENRLRDEAEAKRKAEEARQSHESATKKGVKQEYRHSDKEAIHAPFADGNTAKIKKSRKKTNIKKGVFAVLFIALVALTALFFFSLFNTGPELKSSPLPVNDSLAVPNDRKPKIDLPEEKAPILKLAIGDTYGGGIVFSFDEASATGKIAHLNDAGPMPWKNAMNIHEQLGQGWRLPTFDELRLMYRTIGQGADNSGQFADALYWSATPYETYQARLLRFRDGNTSYHYNKEVEHRKFLVRAIKDF
ncbi:TIR domain-containing protein [Flavobacteriaceae bacterium TP-CH-4]|uniref:TIR domain-containing protein n=1 Tax=Pelagihabitans pacificus TaxID=2696054 RepID=A0A967AVA8_9FLAO|nr:TIR domain-containing protein [Pelagihabitans pacificus]NHF59830.1 TIR domain-containing protein [Pelagihabitans pacificus]